MVTMLMSAGVAPGTEPTRSTQVLSCEEVAVKAAPLLEKEDIIALNEAIKLFSEVLKKRSDCVPALVGYARALNSARGFSITAGDYYLAYEYLARALVLDPDNGQAWWVMADLQRHVRRYDRALPIAQRAVQMAPKDPWAHYVFGSTLMSVNMEEAVKEFERALELKQDWAIVRINLSAAYIHTGKYSKALEQLDAYLEANPGDVKALTNRGIVYLEQGKTDKAEKDFQKALEINPRFGLALKGMGDLHMAKKELPKAIESYKLALVSMPGDGALWILLAEAQLTADLIEDAIASYERAAELFPKNEDIKKRLGELKTKHKKQESP